MVGGGSVVELAVGAAGSGGVVIPVRLAVSGRRCVGLFEGGLMKHTYKQKLWHLDYYVYLQYLHCGKLGQHPMN